MDFAKIEASKVYDLKSLVPYEEKPLNQKIITKKVGGSMILMSFQEGQGLKEHQVSADAIVQVLDGKCIITLAGVEHHLKAGEFIIMPANTPHKVDSEGAFKMLLTRIKPE